jgi:hypothetical protein
MRSRPRAGGTSPWDLRSRTRPRSGFWNQQDPPGEAGTHRLDGI